MAFSDRYYGALLARTMGYTTLDAPNNYAATQHMPDVLQRAINAWELGRTRHRAQKAANGAVEAYDASREYLRFVGVTEHKRAVANGAAETAASELGIEAPRVEFFTTLPSDQAKSAMAAGEALVSTSSLVRGFAEPSTNFIALNAELDDAAIVGTVYHEVMHLAKGTEEDARLHGDLAEWDAEQVLNERAAAAPSPVFQATPQPSMVKHPSQRWVFDSR